MSQFSISGRVICGQRAAIPSEPFMRQGDLSHTRHPRVIDTLRQSRNHPPQQRTDCDLIVGLGSVSAMVTLRERKTQYGIIVNLPLDHTAVSVNAAIIDVFATLPPHLKRTLTWDQGVELAWHEKLTQTTGVPVFFAERSSPWQHGANENFNGLARQYFPKGTNLALHSAKHVANVVKELNDRPRKTLDYDTPAERLNAEYDTPAINLR